MRSLKSSFRDEAIRWFWVLPPIIVTILQYYGITVNGNSIQSQVQISDAAGWLTCASSFPLGEFWKDGWCMRRPNAFLLLSPIAKSIALGAGVPVFFQTLVLSGCLSYLGLTLAKGGIPRHIILGGLILSVWVVLVNGVYMGPEALSLSFSALSLAFLVRALENPLKRYLFLGPLLVCLAYTMRPGNPLLTLVVSALFVFLAFRATGLSLNPFVSAGLAAVPFLVPGVLRGLGYSEAGHSANFASTIYSLVDRNVSGWPEVYEMFSYERTGLDFESFAWRRYVLSEASQVFQADPTAAFVQGFRNLIGFLDIGFLNMMMATGGPRVDLLRLTNWLEYFAEPLRLVVDLLSLILWIASWALIVGLMLRIARDARFNFRWVEVNGTDGFKKVIDSQVYLVLASATLLGAIGTYVLVGHDESSRHIVSNIPYLVLLFYPPGVTPVRDSLLIGDRRTNPR